MDALTVTAKKILAEGRVRIQVKRAGMLQQITFVVKRVSTGGTHFVELYFARMIDSKELERVANETGLPVEAETMRAFPCGKGAKDFLGL